MNKLYYALVLAILTIITGIINIFEDLYDFGIPNGSSVTGKMLSIFFREVDPYQIPLIIKDNKYLRKKPKFPDRVMFMANHISIKDGFILFSVLPNKTKFISSGPMWDIPILKDIAKISKHIEIKFDGDKCTNRDEMLSKTKQALDFGNPVCVFPEGGINRFKLKKGMFLFAKKHNINIIPIRIDNTNDDKTLLEFHIGDLIKTKNHEIDSLMTQVSKHIFNNQKPI
jgi:1-acyl-sn-glycerol-3-phosphate acyltransferase